MKKVIIALAITSALFAGTIFSGCESSNSKVVTTDHNMGVADDWQTFRSDAEVKIKNNEIRIAEARVKMSETGVVMDAVLEKKIDMLEERNKNLRMKIDAYEYNESGWESFKREFNHDMDEIGNAFRDLGVDNKK